MQINSSLVPLEEHNSVLDNPKKTTSSINDVHQLDIEILFFYFFLLPSL